MITYADKAIAKSKYPSLTENKALEQYFLDNIILWSNTLESLSLSQDYKISNGQNSQRELTRVEVAEAQTQLSKWTEKLENLNGGSTQAPKFATIQTHGGYQC